MREVDDALREEQMASAFKRWGMLVGAVSLAALAALAGGLWWKSHQDSLAQDRGIALTRAIDQIEGTRSDLAAATLDPIAKGDAPGSASVARLIQAGLAMQAGKPADAAKIYDAVAADANAPQPLRDLATVRGTAAAFDTLPPATIVTRLKPLALPGNAWFGPAGEMLALAYLKQGNNAQAGTLLGAIAKDKDVPDTLKARSRQLAGLLGYDSIDDIAHPAEQQAPAAQPPAAQPPAGQPAPAAAPAPAAPAQQ